MGRLAAVEEVRPPGGGVVARRWQVALCGYYGFGNLGDELLAEAMVASLEREGVPRSGTVLLTADPQGAGEKGLDAVQRWSLRDVYGALCRSDTLLLGGGGLFQDSTSLRSCVYYWGVVRLARLAGALPWCVGQSVGPFRTARGAALARNALSRCVVRGVRDQRSHELLKTWGLTSTVTPDPAVSLSRSTGNLMGQGKRLLVNLRPWLGDLADRTAGEVTRRARGEGLAVTGVALSDSDLRLMEDQARRGILEAEEMVLLTPGNWTAVAQMLFGEAAGAVSMRYHFGLLALIAGLPVTLSAYDPKVEELGREWSVPVWKGTGEFPAPQGAEASMGKELADRFGDGFRTMWADVRARNGKGKGNS